MVTQLIGVTIGIAVAIIVIIAVFSVMPGLFETFECPDPATMGPHGNGTGADDGAVAWAESCANVKTQTAIVPVLITLAVVIAAILIVARMFQTG